MTWDVFDEYSNEMVASFNTYDEAVSYVSKQKRPTTYFLGTVSVDTGTWSGKRFDIPLDELNDIISNNSKRSSSRKRSPNYVPNMRRMKSKDLSSWLKAGKGTPKQRKFAYSIIKSRQRRS